MGDCEITSFFVFYSFTDPFIWGYKLFDLQIFGVISQSLELEELGSLD